MEDSKFVLEGLLMDLMVRVVVLEKVITDKNIISQDELHALSEDIAGKVSEFILKKHKA